MDETLNLGTIVKRQRNRLGITLVELAAKSGVSTSHLGRIESTQRYPSTTVLRKIAKPLGLAENELFNLAGYLPTDVPKTPDLEKHKLLAELDILVDRIASDTNRVKTIIHKLNTK